MENKNLRKVVIDGLMIAVVFLATYFTKFPGPIPPGYINLGDAVIIVSAVIFGRRNALVAGAIGSALADFAVGALIFVPVTFVVKGLEGLVMGLIIEKAGKGRFTQISAIIVGMAIMVLGYFISEATFLGAIDSSLGWTAAIFDLQPNLIQAVASAVIGYALSFVLAKNKALSY